jgi:radical SAM protein with 4Fe4S-binding SPASM domain
MINLRRYLESRKTPKSSTDAQQVEVLSFVREAPGEKAHIHLRTDPDGSGLLLVNASRVMHLNPSAAFMARLVLNETPAPQAISEITHRYKVSKQQAKGDYTQFCDQLEEVLRPDGLCPIHDLNLEVIPPFSSHPAAPYRMDLALTYRCNNDCAHCYNARARDYPELSTAEWKAIIDRLWQCGIPHLVFTGGEPTLRRDLPELIQHAQKTGMVAGLNTNGRRLSDPAFLQELVAAGLDHVQITLESHDPQIHDGMVSTGGAWKQTVAGIRNALDSPLYVMTNTTMLTHNSPVMEQTLAFLADLGVPTVGLNALIYAGGGAACGAGLEEGQLKPLLELARRATADSGQRLIWYTPTQYCHFDPMDLELGVKGCTAALYNMCIEPDGAVIPCQSYYQPLGYLLKDSWESIWNHELALDLRQRHYISQDCKDCLLLSECGGGCPLTNHSAHHR